MEKCDEVDYISETELALVELQCSFDDGTRPCGPGTDTCDWSGSCRHHSPPSKDSVKRMAAEIRAKRQGK